MRDAIAILRPKLFVAENVDGLSQNFGGKYLKTISEDFTSVGYRVEHRLVDAVSYGVPQHRRRIIFVGVREDQPDFSWPATTHELPNRNGESRITPDGRTLWDFPDDSVAHAAVTIRQALATLPARQLSGDHAITNNWPKNYELVFLAIGPGQKLCNVRHSPTSIYTWQIPEVFGAISSRQRNILQAIGRNRRHRKYGTIPNGNPLSALDISTLLDSIVSERELQELVEIGYLKETENKYDLKGAMFCSGLFKRPVWDEPSPTVLTNFHNRRYFLHPSENRPFTLRECARLQGFPDSFRFTDAGITLEDGYRLVGNAVPPIISRAFAKAIRAYLGINTKEALCAA